MDSVEIVGSTLSILSQSSRSKLTLQRGNCLRMVSRICSATTALSTFVLNTSTILTILMGCTLSIKLLDLSSNRLKQKSQTIELNDASFFPPKPILLRNIV
jgi:hypothetical protein